MEAASGFGLTWRVGDDTLKIFQQYNIDLEEASGESHHLLPVPAVYILDARYTLRRDATFGSIRIPEADAGG